MDTVAATSSSSSLDTRRPIAIAVMAMGGQGGGVLVDWIVALAEAAVLCPSFYRADIIINPTGWDRAVARMRAAVIGFFQRLRSRRRLRLA